MRRPRTDLPTERVQWKSERTLWGDLKSTLAQGDALIYPFTVRQVRRIKALQSRAGALGLRVRAVTGLHQDKLYAWVEERVARRARGRTNVVALRRRSG
jgi:hypothetical protein